MIVGMGNPVQTIPLSAAALQEIDIIGTFRYVNTYLEAIELTANSPTKLPDLAQLITHRYEGLAAVELAFEMAGRSHDEAGRLVLKVVVTEQSR